jgi:hypothetical protein
MMAKARNFEQSVVVDLLGWLPGPEPAVVVSIETLKGVISAYFEQSHSAGMGI